MAVWPTLLLILACPGLPGWPEASEPPSTAAAPKNGPLRDELLAMARDDQDAIRRIEASTPSGPGDAEIVRRSREVHERNNTRIQAIVVQHGWPGKSLVGADGAHAAWLLVQHSDGDRVFQGTCLDLMRQAFTVGEVAAQDLAYLTDRVLMAQGQPQMYGTQGAPLLSPEEEARVDVNRFAIGLEPLRVFRAKRVKPFPESR